MEYVGQHWNSGKAWKSKGGISYWNGSDNRPKIEIKVDDTGFNIKYIGKASGYAISHAKNGTGDTLHQVFNVIMFECNPYLLKGKLKPDIESIQTTCNLSKGLYNMTISIPFVNVDEGIYQINRRGGMGWDPTETAIKSSVGKVKNMVGPKKVVVKASGVIITEYFVTYDIDTKSAVISKPVKSSRDEIWFKYETDTEYVYQQRNDVWFAKHTLTDKIFNISINSKFTDTINKLNDAKKNNKLTIFN